MKLSGDPVKLRGAQWGSVKTSGDTDTDTDTDKESQVLGSVELIGIQWSTVELSGAQ